VTRFAVAEEVNPVTLRQIAAILEAKSRWTEVEKRLDSALWAAVKMQKGEPIAPGIQALPAMWDQIKLDAAGLTAVEVRGEVTDELLSSLAALGVKVEAAYPEAGVVTVRTPLQQVYAVASLSGVRGVHVPTGYRTNTGPNNSQGDAAHRANVVRGMGITGAGVKVGVISDGVLSLAARQAAGDLPAVTVLVPGPNSGPPADEGTAMLEIVHDIAPQAQLYFASALGTGTATPLVMANSVRVLAAAGCRVIVDDITYLNEGAFQDGPIAQAVNEVTAAGVLYFSSAANSGNKNDGTSGTWEGDFSASGLTFDYDDGTGPKPVHQFAPGQTLNAFTELPSGPAPTSLKWSDPLGQSANDYDLFITNSTGGILAFSVALQDGDDDPFEFILNAQAVNRAVMIVRYSGQARALRVDTNRSEIDINTAGNTYGHNAGASTVTVAATDARATGGGAFVGGGANPVETFSSDGPRRIFYYPDGTPITPGNFLFGTNGGLVLQKPDITAADCVTTGTPGFTTFCGTSAAAPHAAAIAALALSSASAPGTGVVKAIMAATALDIEAAGIDRDSGVGIVMADRTISGLAPPVGGALRLQPVSPCRIVDTRNPNSALGGPALIALGQRAFVTAGTCGVPTTAKALSLNVTVTGPTTPGNLRIFPVGVAAPVASSINFYPGQTRANNAVVQVGGGTLAGIVVQNDAPAPVHFILDVNGYFQ
jgi:hypothetical protein